MLSYIEQDDEYMYFEVFNYEDEKYVSKGTIYIGKVRPLSEKAKTDE